MVLMLPKVCMPSDVPLQAVNCAASQQSNNCHLFQRSLASVAQASHMIHSADDNGDKRLTVDEMLNNPYVFYSAAVDDEEESWHDEF